MASELRWTGLCQDVLDLPGGAGIACGIASVADPIGTVQTAGDLVRLANAAQSRATRAGLGVPVVARRPLPAAAAVGPVGASRP